jgi:hypothetical protein
VDLRKEREDVATHYQVNTTAQVFMDASIFPLAYCPQQRVLIRHHQPCAQHGQCLPFLHHQAVPAQQHNKL